MTNTPPQPSPPQALLAVAQDPAHPQNSLAIGKVLGSVLLGSIDALGALKDQAHIDLYIKDFVSGFLDIWLRPKPLSDGK